MRKTRLGCTILEGHDIADLPLVSQNAEILDNAIKDLEDEIGNLNADGITLPDGKTISEKFTEITTEIGNTEELDTETKLSLVAAINEINQALVAHKADDVSQREVHGLRVNNEKLEYYTGTEWKIASGGIPVGNVSGLSVEEGNAEITLMWTDPEDRYLDDVKIAEWKGTKIIRKTGSYPVSDDDGVLVVDNTVRNQYSNNGYKDTGLTNEVTYYYMAFPYTEDAITVDGANRVAGTPTDPDDPTGSPGNDRLLKGTMEEGYFGAVSSSDLISGDELASKVGVTQGTAQHSNTPWHKFAYKGKILFVAQKTIRHSISWDHLNYKNVVYGNKTIEIDGVKYKVRLLKGALTDPSDYNASDKGAKGSEWNRLIAPLNHQRKYNSWDYPAYMESDLQDWETYLNDKEMTVRDVDGTRSWCQEVSGEGNAYRVSRGHDGVSSLGSDNSSNSYSSRGWRPVLEVVQ